MLPAVPFIKIGGKQKITMASICDKKEILWDIKGRPRLQTVRLCIILAFHIALIYYTQDFRVYEGTRDQPMPGPFPTPPIF